ncbi:MAG TPA: LexA family transcriptional regulator [Terriglobales bacterium]
MRTGAELARPEWANRIEKLREKLQLNQAGLARLLHVSPMAVSRWERAINEPEAGFYIQMGTLAGEPDCWYFWQRAGLPSSDLMRSLRKTSGSRPSDKSPQEPPETPLHPVPLLSVTASTSERGDNEPNLDHLPTESTIVLPKEWTQNHLALRSIHVSGDGMHPFLQNGSIAAVDLSQFDRGRLYGHVVLVWHKDYGLKIHRLQKDGENDVLLSEVSGNTPVFVLDRNWRILGRVVWWLTRPRSAAEHL